jgi:CheY-like chemotaxis protein
VLQENPQWQIIGEASDGLEAIQKANELQPDLIVLDVSLPKLNGIEAAQSFFKVAPESKILFLSANRSSVVAAAALSAGGHGYAVKSDGASELLVAVEAVLQGRRFVSNYSPVSISLVLKGNPATNCPRQTLAPSLGDLVVHGVVAFFPSKSNNSVSGIANSVKPQSMQTRSVGNIKTCGLSRSFSPGKWTAISEANVRWFSEVHDLHVIVSPHASMLVTQRPSYVSVCLPGLWNVPCRREKSDGDLPL